MAKEKELSERLVDQEKQIAGLRVEGPRLTNELVDLNLKLILFFIF